MANQNGFSHSFTILVEQDEDGYLVATVPTLKSCYTQAKTFEDLIPRVKEVIELCLENENHLSASIQEPEFLIF